MGRPRQYGTRRRTVAATAGVIFGSEPSPAPSTAQAVSRKTRSQPLEDWRSVAQTLDEVAQEPPPQQSEPDESDNSSESEECQESELESIEETDNDLEEEDEERVDVISDTDSCVAETSKPLHSDSILSDSEHSSISHSYYGEPAPEHLSALADAYKIDRGTDLIISKWSEVIPPTAAIFKIAEASFAEVYRINTKDGTSIIKVLQLKVPTDPACSEISTAIDATDLVAEIRIMNILAEVPGFVGFKDAHLMQGRWAPALHAAYTEFLSEDIDGHEEAYEEEEGDGGEDEGEEPKSYFPDPEIFTDESTFLVLELADAGTVLEECEVTTIDQVWDLLLGVIMALSRAEAMCEFEHRDLHENNICVRQKHHIPSHDPISDGDVKYGFSGYVVTIIDYGLSRARVENGDIVFQDLEKDLELFHGESGGMHGMQFDNYRRMRNHLFTGTRTMLPASWHDEISRSSNNGHTWSEHIPYTNVLWIRYILSYLTKTFKRSKPLNCKEDLKAFETETKVLKRKLDVRMKVENGAFSSAMEVLEYAFGKGWVSEEQLEEFGMDSTILS